MQILIDAKFLGNVRNSVVPTKTWKTLISSVVLAKCGSGQTLYENGAYFRVIYSRDVLGSQSVI